MSRLLFCWLLCWSLGVIADPRVFDFTPGGRDAKSPEVRKYGDARQVEYFRLLEADRDHLIIGAADSVHNISIEHFERVSLYEWKPSENAIDECLMKTPDSTACRNYVRVLSRDERNGRLLICGTNAYQPLCRIVDHENQTVSQFPGTGISPLDPAHNTSFYREDDFLYAATVADFAGTDSLIFRKNVSRPEDRGLRTQRFNTMQLNRPQFIGALHSDEFVYFFFREEAPEAESTTFSRVARVCKDDAGGPHPYDAEWTTFVKMRLNCSIPEKNKPFYFDEIISISNITRSSKKSGRRIVYATFVSEFNFLRHSVVCAFDLNEIDGLFASSDYLALDSDRKKWTRKRRNEADRTAKIGQCHNNSRELTEDDVITFRQFPLLADAAPNVFGRAVGIHRGSDHFNQIVVLEAVQTQDGQADVLYVGTDQGNVIKMVNLAEADGWNATREEDPMVQVAVYKLSDVRATTTDPPSPIAKNRHLIVVTDSVVFRLPLHFCSAYSPLGCDECVQSRDPHCVWHHGACTNVKDVKTKFAYQDVLQRKSRICDEARAVEKPLVNRRPKPQKANDPPLQRNETGGLPLDGCNCELEKRPEVRAKCNCAGGFERKTPTTVAADPSPIISDEVETQNAGYGYAPWVAFGLLILVTQTVIMLVVCFRNRSKKARRKKPGITIQMPKTSVQSVINAYGPTDAYSEKAILPPLNGTLRRGPMGEVSIHLDGSAIPSLHY
ncbi:Sema domain-containing protein [Aphelenchoides fujianensis]|nr:Sema domain-containing protein [Aphelenchoides fujianensis]